MNSKIVEDAEVEEFFSHAQASTFLSFLEELRVALERYSANPSIIPPRIVGNIPSGSTLHMYMPVIDDVYSGVKTLGYNASSHLGFVGSINITDAESGMLYGTLQAKQITAIRTALASCVGLSSQLDKFEDTDVINCTVFGSGLQAFWHIVCCVSLFSGSGKRFNVTILYRTREMDVKQFENICAVNESIMQLTFNQVKLSDNVLKSRAVADSHVIFGCIPSEAPNLLYRDLADVETKVSHTYISLIGSFKPLMHECDQALIEEFQRQKIRILVDSKEHCLLEAGELIDCDVKEDQLQEIGHLSRKPLQAIRCGQNNRKISLCKIVGLSIMDICVGKKLLELSNSD
ncbi:hypothetical protein HG536_0G01520 [Torulaspora globosa]|uniref:Ornithine cyclodeaminase n=1 Tax=Torulaspora globosa TaxID=48254 RepID=A0A7G3ZLA7_9SACH|nr:uncharacterized protein HG536_0G01520 [Torulaspora globosa]QLL34293.1 hypothetical protein HG536_0G01520 [Torulaspora globosa]